MSELFGEKLAYLRRLRRLTQTDLARQLGLASHAHISHLKSGRKVPSLDLVLRVTYVLGVSTDYLLRDTMAVEALAEIDRTLEPDPSALPQLFGLKVRYLRNRHKMTQAEVSQRLGLRTQAHISLLESGKSEASPELVVQIADIFGVTTDYLLLDAIPVIAEGDDGQAETR